MKKLKPTWDDVQRALPDVDYKDINAIRNSNGKHIPVQVTLMKDGADVLNATVGFYGSPKSLYAPALYMLERRMKENDIVLEWNEVCFVGNGAPLARLDPMVDPLVQAMDRSLLLPFDDTLRVLRESFAQSALPEQIIPNASITRLRMNMFNDAISAAILAHTATVVSEDLERMIYAKKFHLPFTNFKPKGQEF